MADVSLRYLLFGSDVTASKVFKELGANAKETGNKIGESTEHTSSKLGALGKVGAVAFAGLAVGLAGVAGESLELADKFEGAQVRLEGAVANSGGSFEELKGKIDHTNKSMENFGFTSNDTEDALATLTNATHSPEKAMSQMALAADIAKGRNISLADATSILVKVNTGHVALLGKLGINTKDATGKTITQAQAIARLSQMYGGDAQRSAETFGGKQAALTAKLKDAGAQLGMVLMPILLKLVTFITDKLIPGIQWLWTKSAPYFKLLVAYIRDVVVPEVKKLWTDVQPYLQAFADFMVNVVWPAIKQLWDKIQPLLKTIEDIFKAEFNIYKTVIRDAIQIIMDMWDRFGGQLIGHLRTAWDAIKQMLQGAFQVIQGIFDLFRDLLTGKWGKLWGDLMEIVDGVWNLISGYIKFFINEISTEIGLGMAAISLVWSKIWGGIRAVAAGIWAGIKFDALAVVGFFTGLPGKFAAAGAGMFTWLVAAMKMPINTVIGIWDYFTSKLNIPSIHIPGISAFGQTIWPSFDTPGIDIGSKLHIPMLAQGGTVKATPGGVLALLGEGRYDERVTPLDGRDRGGGGGLTIHVHVSGLMSSARDVVTAIENAYGTAAAQGYRPKVLATQAR